MFALRIEYLTGRAVATSYNDRQTAEWPPHPARVFSALVATWAEYEQDPVERAALDWLSAQAPPSIAASDATRRAVVPHYVPVNDISVLRKFESEVAKIATLERSLGEDETSLSVVEASGDTKETAKIRKRIEKTRANLEKQRKLLDQKRAADLEPDKPTTDALSKAAMLLPELRLRQARAFPSVTPGDPVAHLLWESDPPDLVRSALDAIARRIVRIGHSSSLVSCRIESSGPSPSLVPLEEGDEVLRVPAPGQVERLLAAYERHREVEPRVMPARFQRYGLPREGAAPLSRSLFSDDWIVLRQSGGPRLSSTLALEVAQAVRGALMSHGQEPLPEVLTGHQPDGEPSQRPHAAVLTITLFGSPHATGLILGAAIVLPRDLSLAEKTAVLRALAVWEGVARKQVDDEWVEAPPLELRLGSRGVIELERIVWGHSLLGTLHASTWCRPSRVWSSATPVALDRNPGNLFSGDARVAESAFATAGAIVAESCHRIGLPHPVRVEILPSVTMPGVAKARRFAPFPADPAKTRRVLVHAMLEFEERVRGPILLGAGRYHGLGLFRPVESEGVAP